MIKVRLLFIYTSIHFRPEYIQDAMINRMAFGSTLEVTPIQRNPVKQGKRDVISRHFTQGKKFRLEPGFIRIPCVFNVRSVASV